MTVARTMSASGRPYLPPPGWTWKGWNRAYRRWLDKPAAYEPPPSRRYVGADQNTTDGAMDFDLYAHSGPWALAFIRQGDTWTCQIPSSFVAFMWTKITIAYASGVGLGDMTHLIQTKWIQSGTTVTLPPIGNIECAALNGIAYRRRPKRMGRKQYRQYQQARTDLMTSGHLSLAALTRPAPLLDGPPNPFLVSAP